MPIFAYMKNELEMLINAAYYVVKVVAVAKSLKEQ